MTRTHPYELRARIRPEQRKCQHRNFVENGTGDEYQVLLFCFDHRDDTMMVVMAFTRIPTVVKCVPWAGFLDAFTIQEHNR